MLDLLGIEHPVSSTKKAAPPFFSFPRYYFGDEKNGTAQLY
jgi:hypothetical protein